VVQRFDEGFAQVVARLPARYALARSAARARATFALCAAPGL